MSDSNNMWPFQEISAEEGLDINEIFGTGTSSGTAAPEANPFQVPQQAVPAPETTTRSRQDLCANLFAGSG